MTMSRFLFIAAGLVLGPQGEVRYQLVGVVARGDTVAYAVHEIVGMPTRSLSADEPGAGFAMRLSLHDGEWFVAPSASLLFHESSEPSASYSPPSRAPGPGPG
jgi:hypothetical protein